MKEEDKLDFKKDDPELAEPKVVEMTLEEWEKANGINAHVFSDEEEGPREK